MIDLIIYNPDTFEIKYDVSTCTYPSCKIDLLKVDIPFGSNYMDIHIIIQTGSNIIYKAILPWTIKLDSIFDDIKYGRNKDVYFEYDSFNWHLNIKHKENNMSNDLDIVLFKTYDTPLHITRSFIFNKINDLLHIEMRNNLGSAYAGMVPYSSFLEASLLATCSEKNKDFIIKYGYQSCYLEANTNNEITHIILLEQSPEIKLKVSKISKSKVILIFDHNKYIMQLNNDIMPIKQINKLLEKINDNKYNNYYLVIANDKLKFIINGDDNKIIFEQVTFKNNESCVIF